MADILVIIAAILVIGLLLKIAFKVLKAFLILGVLALVLYYLVQYGFLNGFLQ